MAYKRINLFELLDISIVGLTDGQVLTYSATDGKWINSTSSGGGGINTIAGVSAQSASFTVSTGDIGKLFDCTTDSATTFTVTLPSASTVGNSFWIWVKRNSASGNRGVLTSPATQAIYGDGETMFVWSDGTNWNSNRFIAPATGGGMVLNGSTYPYINTTLTIDQSLGGWYLSDGTSGIIFSYGGSTITPSNGDGGCSLGLAVRRWLNGYFSGNIGFTNSSDPTPVTGASFIYSKSVGGSSELFGINELGVTYQLTGGGGGSGGSAYQVQLNDGTGGFTGANSDASDPTELNANDTVSDGAEAFRIVAPKYSRTVMSVSASGTITWPQGIGVTGPVVISAAGDVQYDGTRVDFWSGSGAGDTQISRIAASVLQLNDRSGGGSTFEMLSVSAGSTPSTGGIRIYAKEIAGTAEFFATNELGVEYQLTGIVQTAVYSVSGLSSITSPMQGMQVFVTDAVARNTSPVVGSGSVACPVWYDGTQWIS